MYSNLTPIIALMGGWLILGEQPALAQFAGVVLILSGIFIVRSMKPVLFLQEARVRMSGMVKQKAGRRFLWPWR
jgi:drug/metabolite transporter (DMT)-like permease